MDPIEINGLFKLDSCSKFKCYIKMIFILLFSEMRRLLCNKKLIIRIISWGPYFSPLIMDESWCHWCQNDPGQARILKILKYFKNLYEKWVKIEREVVNLSISIGLDDLKLAKTGSRSSAKMSLGKIATWVVQVGGAYVNSSKFTCLLPAMYRVYCIHTSKIYESHINCHSVV